MEKDELQTMEDLELSEFAKRRLDILKKGIPYSSTIEVFEELIRRFRGKLTN